MHVGFKASVRSANRTGDFYKPSVGDYPILKKQAVLTENLDSLYCHTYSSFIQDIGCVNVIFLLT